MVARGEQHQRGIHRLKAQLTRDNHEQALAAAKHKRIRQIEELVAHLRRWHLRRRHQEHQHQDLLAHQIPNGAPAVIVERALHALLTQVYQRKAAAWVARSDSCFSFRRTATCACFGLSLCLA